MLGFEVALVADVDGRWELPLLLLCPCQLRQLLWRLLLLLLGGHLRLCRLLLLMLLLLQLGLCILVPST